MPKVTMVRFGEVTAEVRTWPVETRAKLADLIEKWAQVKEPQTVKARRGRKTAPAPEGSS
jgi:hypothetical protein